MNYADLTRNTTEPLKRLAHGPRLDQAARVLPISPEMKILDYGCGDGGFFESLEKFAPSGNLYGFDPGLLGEMTFEGATTYDMTEPLLNKHRGSFDVVYCLEVCEHLNHKATFDLFRIIRELTKSDGTVVFGVPIETGLSGFLKNIYRWTHGRRQGATFGRAVKSLFGLWIPRATTPTGWIDSHLGFDARFFSEQLDCRGFEVVHRRYLPAPTLRGLLNNEVYFVCRLKALDEG